MLSLLLLSVSLFVSLSVYLSLPLSPPSLSPLSLPLPITPLSLSTNSSYIITLFLLLSLLHLGAKGGVSIFSFPSDQSTKNMFEDDQPFDPYHSSLYFSFCFLFSLNISIHSELLF
jgi:hypothetical protein